MILKRKSLLILLSLGAAILTTGGILVIFAFQDPVWDEAFIPSCNLVVETTFYDGQVEVWGNQYRHRIGNTGANGRILASACNSLFALCLPFENSSKIFSCEDGNVVQLECDVLSDVVALFDRTNTKETYFVFENGACRLFDDKLKQLVPVDLSSVPIPPAPDGEKILFGIFLGTELDDVLIWTNLNDSRFLVVKDLDRETDFQHIEVNYDIAGVVDSHPTIVGIRPTGKSQEVFEVPLSKTSDTADYFPGAKKTIFNAPRSNHIFAFQGQLVLIDAENNRIQNYHRSQDEIWSTFAESED